jgi:predicted metal-dependent peptidase
LYNIAADIALNQLINSPAKLPEGAMFPETFDFPKGKTAEVYYELLQQEKEKQEQEKEEKEGNGESWNGPSDGKPDLTEGGEGDSFDDHSMWGEVPEGEEELARSSMEKMVKDALSQSRGNVPGNIEEILDLWRKKAIISWKRVLKRILASKPGSKVGTIKRRDRRQPKRIDVKGKKKFYDKPTVIVGVDTSGSMDDEMIVNGLVEIAEVCKVTGSNLEVVQIDTEIKGTETFDAKKKTFERKGYGGTYMGAMPEWLNKTKKEHDVLIMISDLFIEDVCTDENWLKHKKPVIWLNTSGTEMAVPKKHKIFDISDA